MVNRRQLLVLSSPVGMVLLQRRAKGSSENPLTLMDAVLRNEPSLRYTALSTIEQRGNLDVVPALIEIMRFLGPDAQAIGITLNTLTGQRHGDDWFSWMLWLEESPQIKVFERYPEFKKTLVEFIDPAFPAFFESDNTPLIRLEEIVWGGVRKDGIPALDQPGFIEASEARYLGRDELVLGVALNGDARAYPLRIMDWHEMANDTVGGQSVALSYCTLCGSAILFNTARSYGQAPWIFGSSGFLYRSNKLMFDRATESLWNQFTGQPVVGPLAGRAIKLEILPVTLTSWQEWQEKHPNTRVLSLDTGHSRDYTPGRPYGSYFSSPDLMFPAVFEDERLQAKDYVYRVRHDGIEKAWPLNLFEGGAVIADTIGADNLVLVGNTATRTVRVYHGRGVYAWTLQEGELFADGEPVNTEEAELTLPDGAQFSRLGGHIAYAFAWRNFVPSGITG